jgi:two-component system, OmpR family, sensor histidine kinase PhoQ
MKALSGSLRLRFIAGTAVGLLLISMIYAILAILGQNMMQLRYTNQWMERDIDTFMSLVQLQDGQLKLSDPGNALRKHLYATWVFSADNQLLWQSRDLPEFHKRLSQEWLRHEGLYEINNPRLLPGSHDREGNLLPEEEDSLLRHIDEYSYFAKVQHYPATADRPELRVIMVDTVPEEREDNSYLWHAFQAVTLVNLLILLPIVWIAAKWSLRPIDQLAVALQLLEQGKTQQLEFVPPRELTYLVNNLNLLLQQQRQQLERYRHSLDDLAHSIKTPLAVLQSSFHSLRQSPEQLVEQEPLMQDQISRISQQIGYYLRRARTGPELGLFQQQHDVEELVTPLCNALQKVYARKGVVLTLTCEQGLSFYGDRNDFMEIVGNILENACKYCLEYVEIHLYAEQEQLVLDVSDDGPGVPANRREQILQRGVRVDTFKPGQGIGLAVATEIMQAYGGVMTITQSELGGARFNLRFNHPA